MKLDSELSIDDLKALVDRFKELYRDKTGEDFPQDPQVQLEQAIRAVFDSWMGARAVEYRRINRIPDDWGTAVNVQQMVFGNKGDSSCSGVAFSRDEITGAPEPSGDFLVNAQGEDVVSGVRTPRPLEEMARGDAGRARGADGDPAHARGALPRHAGHRVHRRGGAPLHAPDAQREAAGAGRRAVRRRRRRGGPARARGGARDDRRRARSTRCCTRRSTRTPSSTCSRAASTRRPARPRARSCSPPTRRSRPARRGATSCSSARSPRPTTSPASSPRRASSRARAARPATRRSSRAAWAGRRCAARPSSRSTSRRARCA